MKAETPPEAFIGLLMHIRPHVDDIGWAKLARAVGMPLPAAPAHQP